MLSRTGYTGELGYEIYCHPNDAVKVWDALWKAGKEFNLSPMGFEASRYVKNRSRINILEEMNLVMKLILLKLV